MGYVLSGEIVLKNKHYYYYYLILHYFVKLRQSLSRLVLRMSTLDTNVDGSIPASICFLLEQETLSALLQSTQL